MTTTFTATDAIDAEGAIFDCNSGIYSGVQTPSFDGRQFRHQCYTCCSVYQMSLPVVESHPTCKFCK